MSMINRTEFVNRITAAVLAGRMKAPAVKYDQGALIAAEKYAEDVARKLPGLFPRPPVAKKKKKVGRERLKPLYRTTNGKCYYCGKPVPNGGKFADGRDWLIPDRMHRYVREHKMPVSRGGIDHRDNYVPSCFRCNRVKHSLTTDEFRFLKGLRQYNPQYVFPFERQPPLQRDWLCVHSKEFEKVILIANMPESAKAYNNGGPALR